MYALNCIPTPPDVNTICAGNCLALTSVLPESFSLIEFLPPVQDQGLKGCCVAQAITCMKQCQEKIDIGYTDLFSPTFIYNLRSNRPQSGMYIRDALQIVQDHGILPLKYYPVDYDQEFSLTERLRRKALNYRIRGYARVESIDELKYALVESGPCPIAFPVYQLFGKIWSQYDDPGEGSLKPRKLLGHHAMAVVGWNPEGFVVRNSWGISWGAGGYIVYPYEDWGSHREIWCSYDDQSLRSDDQSSDRTFCRCF